MLPLLQDRYLLPLLLQDPYLLLLPLWDLYLLLVLLQSLSPLAVVCFVCNKCIGYPMAGTTCAGTPLVSAESIWAPGPVWVPGTRQAVIGLDPIQLEDTPKSFPLQADQMLEQGPREGGKHLHPRRNSALAWTQP